MKTTLLYDHFVALGGAEKVSFQIARAIPDCDIQSAYADRELYGDELMIGDLKDFSFAFFDRQFPTFSLLVFYLVKFRVPNKNVNLITSGIFSPLVLFRHRKLANSLVYFHTFPTFVNLSLAQLRGKYSIVPALLFRLFIPIYRYLLRHSVSHANVVFANSKSVQSRLKVLGIETQILYPPVDLDGLGLEQSVTKEYFLSTARLEDNKRVEMILEAFAGLEDIVLHVVGGGSQEKRLRARFVQYKNIKFFGWLKAESIKTEYNQCKALVYIPENEYFGLAPVEAMAAGKPVIGVAEGGLLETVDDPRLGVLLPRTIDIFSLQNCITETNQNPGSVMDICFRKQQAKRFSEAKFVTQLKRHLL